MFAQSLDLSRLELRDDIARIAENVLGTATSGAFSVSEAGALVYQEGQDTTQLTWFDRAGRQLGVLGDPGDYGDLEFSSDEARLSVTMLDASRRSRDLWLFDLDRDLRRQFTFDKANDLSAIWSPSGDRIVFSSNRRGSMDLYEKPADGSAEERLLFASEGNSLAYDWSADGRYILLQTGNELFVLTLDSPAAPRRLAGTGGIPPRARLSPDGRWIAYTSNESGREEVWVIPFPGPGGKWRVSRSGGIAAIGAPGRSTLLFTVRPQLLNRYGYDVTRDGQRFLINSFPEREAMPPLTLVLNWPALLRH